MDIRDLIPVEFTIFTSGSGPLNKRFEILPDGTLERVPKSQNRYGIPESAEL